MNQTFQLSGLLDLQVPQPKRTMKNRKVYVGNIPYNASEQDIMEVLSMVGPVLNFQFNINKDTGKQKGFGFCEYKDSESAESAVRNLNGYEFQNRNIKVHFPDKIDEFQLVDVQKGFDIDEFEKSCEGKTLQQVLEELDINQKYFIMLQIKDIYDNYPKEMEEWLKKSNQMCQIILKMQQDLNMDKPYFVNRPSFNYF